MSIIMECVNIKKEYGDKIILNNVNLKFNCDDKIGIVGSNGCGKTTFADIIDNEKKADYGHVKFYGDNIKIGYMKQSIDNLELCSSLSGGEKTKKKLAGVLYGNYNILILDEPTNHLDYAGVKWLVSEVNKFKGLVIIISHDRYFLDQCVNKIIEIENGYAKEFNGNYTQYRKKKKQEYENNLHLYNIQEKTKEKINDQINELKGWSNKAHKEARKVAIANGNKFGGKEFNRAKAKKMDKSIKSRIKRLEKIDVEGIEKPEEEKSVYFNFINAGKIGSVVVNAKDVSKSFEKKLIFDKSSFYIKQGEKIGIYGPNGCGKSTLVKCILKEISYDGELYVSDRRNIGYISQDVEGLNEESTIMGLFNWNDRKEEGLLRIKLNLLGFNSDSLMKQVNELSLGERMKLKILVMIQNQCDVLILDEPTNHIDIHVREQLENILEEYNGTILLVTHDRYMLQKICNKLLVFENKFIKRYEYNFEEYLSRKENNYFKKSQMSNKIDEDMVLDNRIAALISELSLLKPGSEKYKELDNEYNIILTSKKAKKSY